MELPTAGFVMIQTEKDNRLSVFVVPSSLDWLRSEGLLIHDKVYEIHIFCVCEVRDSVQKVCVSCIFYGLYSVYVILYESSLKMDTDFPVISSSELKHCIVEYLQLYRYTCISISTMICNSKKCY